MALRGLDHPLEEVAVGLLDVGLAGEFGASVAKPERERIANPLEVAGAENPRAADRADRPVEAAARKRRREQLAELALKPADLAAKVLARPPFGLTRRRMRRSERRRPRLPRIGSLDNFGHLGPLSRGLPRWILPVIQ